MSRHIHSKSTNNNNNNHHHHNSNNNGTATFVSLNSLKNQVRNSSTTHSSSVISETTSTSSTNSNERSESHHQQHHHQQHQTNVKNNTNNNRNNNQRDGRGNNLKRSTPKTSSVKRTYYSPNISNTTRKNHFRLTISSPYYVPWTVCSEHETQRVFETLLNGLAHLSSQIECINPKRKHSANGAASTTTITNSGFTSSSSITNDNTRPIKLKQSYLGECDAVLEDITCGLNACTRALEQMIPTESANSSLSKPLSLLIVAHSTSPSSLISHLPFLCYTSGVHLLTLNQCISTQTFGDVLSLPDIICFGFHQGSLTSLQKQVLPFATVPQIPWLPNSSSPGWHYAKLSIEQMTSNPIRDKKRDANRLKERGNERKRFINPIAAASEARKKALLDTNPLAAVAEANKRTESLESTAAPST
jgi:hypothetical protein